MVVLTVPGSASASRLALLERNSCEREVCVLIVHSTVPYRYSYMRGVVQKICVPALNVPNSLAKTKQQ